MADPSPTLNNYCVCFVDLLGQRQALKDQGLLPSFPSNEERAAFSESVTKSIGAIVRLQAQAETLVREATEPKESEISSKLEGEKLAIWDEMRKTKLTTQRWSDGLVFFVSLGDSGIKCPMNAVYHLFTLAGSLCLMGLAGHRPIRGAVDTAWAVEINDGELYGAAVARAYELESEVAQYPRIVLGPRTIDYLEAIRRAQAGDVFIENNRVLAELCLSMIVEDTDGYWILHYLGDAFRTAVTQEQHQTLYRMALEFVSTELERCRAEHNTKLAIRYEHLHQYFLAHKPINN